MSGFVVMVDFRLKPGTIEGFRRLVTENARISLAHEPGCRRFDVVLPRDEPDRVFLYEIYDDEAAFESHKAARHFLQFNEATDALVAAKTLTIGAKHFPDKQG